ncbi:MAG TPA: heavy metal-responsive transcriptional regulator [Pyrinomonadaceae bacterium]|nr:heavy metal-responsive transcriptional regulator [Pyrinomonadaceae bacterium]
MLIGELAKIVNVSADTLRHYERKGVIASPVRSPKGYRLYSPETIERVRLVRRALAVGFTLDELAAILAEREKGGTPCQQAFSLATSKLDDLKERIIEMQNLRDELQTLVLDWCERLDKNESDKKPAFLLETLIGANDSQITTNSKSARNGNLRRKTAKKK